MATSSFDFDCVKAEKNNAMLRYNRLRSIGKLFRCAELCVVLAFLLWISARLPCAVKISGQYFRQLLSIIASPPFVFLLGNGIIVALIANSGRLSADNRGGCDFETEMYEEYVTKSESRPKSGTETDFVERELEEIVYQDKQIICEAKTKNSELEPAEKTSTDSESDLEVTFPKVYRRTRSEKLRKKRDCTEEVGGKKLQRSETEKCWKSQIAEENATEESEDEISNEEFQRTIEEFIAKQLQFRREESMAVTLQNHQG